MVYQLTSGKEIIGRVEHNFNVDYSDWVTRAPLWIADALDQMKAISAYEDINIPLPVEDYIIKLPDFFPKDIRRILAIEYDGLPMRRLNTINPIKQPKVDVREYSIHTYTIKNGYIVTSLDEGEIIIYAQVPAIEYDDLTQTYIPKVPTDSILQGAIEWYIIYCILRRGHRHPVFSLDSNNPVTNPFVMWEKEKKKAMNSIGALDGEDRAEMGRLLRTFAIDLNRPMNEQFRSEASITLQSGITGQVGLL
jgi:hypothetical protein